MKCAHGLNRSMFWCPTVDVKIDNPDFDETLRTVEGIARQKKPEAMLLAWYDEASGTYSPAVECCSEEMPGWLVYAKSRGGNLIIDVNDEKLVFVFLLPENSDAS